MDKQKEAGEVDVAPPPYTATDTSAQPPLNDSEAPSYTAAPEGGSSEIGAIAGVSNRFPLSFNAYFEKKIMSKLFYLGEHAEAPLYAVTMHSGWTTKPLLEMHSGPKDSDPIMATVGYESWFSTGKRTIIKIFPDIAGLSTPAEESSSGSSSGSDSASGPAVAVKTFDMIQRYKWTRSWHELSIEVGIGKDVRQENFEWRRTQGEEVKELDSSGEGWKLVRLEGTATGKNSTSDGKEVVAVWSVNGGWSMTKFCKFQFLGSGATGVLGDTFAIVALISGLKIRYAEYLQNTASNAAGVATA
ncbi:hypothetical protein F4774DRAFT_395865 [Daldinia eschscholtzii]|nr:hypothetical protein F4774DRAFT_395865 [Daldinia eschscholtzii]